MQVCLTNGTYKVHDKGFFFFFKLTLRADSPIFFFFTKGDNYIDKCLNQRAEELITNLR